MKKIIIAGIVATVLGTSGVVIASNGMAKTMALHNGHWIEISCAAAPAHRAHRDLVRACKRIIKK